MQKLSYKANPKSYPKNLSRNGYGAQREGINSARSAATNAARMRGAIGLCFDFANITVLQALFCVCDTRFSLKPLAISVILKPRKEEKGLKMPNKDYNIAMTFDDLINIRVVLELAKTHLHSVERKAAVERLLATRLDYFTVIQAQRYL